MLSAFLAEGAHAAAHGVDGAQLGLLWVVPFAGILLSIALLPLLAPKFWHHHFGKTSIFWALAFLVPFGLLFGWANAGEAALTTLLHEYVPFIVLLYALFVVSGGIFVSGTLVGRPAVNAGLLAFGTIAASALGTTGAAMLLIRPLIRANENRKHKVHIFVFFIFLVANIGGSLTPLGDPPLYLGFLKGVDFFWTFEHMMAPMLLSAAVILAVFFVIEWFQFRREEMALQKRESGDALKIEGAHNILLLLAIIMTVLLSNQFSPPGGMDVAGVHVAYAEMIRVGALILIAFLSLQSTKERVRVENAFTWAPIQEVAILFLGIFVTIVPALATLRAGEAGALADAIALVTNPDGTANNAMYFWMTGGLSSFLDNAPTYLVFFNMAGGGPRMLMNEGAMTLLAISAGAVFMGANTYIGNAPNFMVKSICEERGIAMPSFFGYMAWSVLILLPVFALVTYVFFLP